MLAYIKKFIPKSLFGAYHYFLALTGNAVYLFPGRKLKVIGITGTKGKTTIAYFLYQILKNTGRKTALVSTTFFALGKEIVPNLTKTGMPGRFFLPKFLHQALRHRAKYAVIETTSEGILQHRQRFLDYDIVVFTNLSPEHIERHGGFKNYRQAKEKLFKQCGKIHVLNLNDKNVKHFLPHPARQKWGISLDSTQWRRNPHLGIRYVIEGHTQPDTGKINIQEWIVKKGNKKELAMQFDFSLPFLGKFNVRNFLLAFAAARSLEIPYNDILSIADYLTLPPGRLEELKKTVRKFKIFLDYAHEPLSLESVLETCRAILPAGKNLICLTGAQGGGRDKWKRRAMGSIAAKYCNYIIVGTEDPYDEDPGKINQEVLNGALKKRGFEEEINCFQFTRRREAIRKAINLAKPGDIVILCGKGGEKLMCLGNKKIPWDEEKEVRKILGSSR